MAEQTTKMFMSQFKFYGIPQQYQNGTKGIILSGDRLVEIEIKDWLDVKFPIFKETKQELDYPAINFGLGDFIEYLEFDETFSWLIFGRYSRLDNHNDTIIEFNIDSGVDWLEIKPKCPIRNNSMFKILFTLKKTKKLMKMIKKDKRLSFNPSFNSKMSRTY